MDQQTVTDERRGATLNVRRKCPIFIDKFRHLRVKALLLRSIAKFNARAKDSPLAAKATTSAGWLALGNVSEQSFRFLRNIIITRLLAPEVFGLIAIVIAVGEAIEALSEMGVKYAIVQNPRAHSTSYLNGAWWLSMVRALLLVIIGYIAAPYLAALYDDPSLTPLLRFSVLTFFLRGVASPNLHIAMKDFSFARWVLVSNGGGLIGISLTVLLAFLLRNVWALVLGLAFEAFFRTFLSFIFCPFKPSLRLDKEELRRLVAYTRGFVGLPILALVFSKTDIFVLGKLATKSELGLYSMASGLAYAVSGILGQVMTQIAMPFFSAIQSEKERVNAALSKMLSIVVAASTPLIMLCIFFGIDILVVTYGPAYGQVAIPFAVLFTSSAIQIAMIPLASLFFAIGRPSLHRWFALLRASLCLLLIYPATSFLGLSGAALTILCAMAIAFSFQLHRLSRITGFGSSLFLRSLGTSALWSLFVPFAWLSSQALPGLGHFGRGLIGLSACLVVYVILAASFLSKGKLSQPNAS